jgi:hypothetical protein
VKNAAHADATFCGVREPHDQTALGESIKPSNKTLSTSIPSCILTRLEEERVVEERVEEEGEEEERVGLRLSGCFYYKR